MRERLRRLLSERRGDRAGPCVAGLLLLGAVWLRFSGLGAQGLYLSDEVYLAVHARIFADFFRAAWHGGPALIEQVSRTGGLWHVTAAKPVEFALMTAAALIGGDGDLPLQIVNAAFGAATVALLFVWGRRFSWTAGACAAALLGGLGGHVWYSRNLLAVAPAVFLLCLGAFLYSEARARGSRALLSAGLCLGLAVGVHYNALPAAALVLLHCAWRGGRRSALVLLAGVVLPLSLLEAAFLIRDSMSSRPMLDYLGELGRYLFQTSHRDAGEPWQAGLLLRWLALSSGATPTVLLGLGLAAFAAARREELRRPTVALLWAALGPGLLLVWSAASLWWAQVARPVGNLLPFLCLAGGLGWAEAAEEVRRRGWHVAPWARLALPFLLFAAGLPRAREYGSSLSPYKGAAAFLSGQKGSVATWNATLLQFYAPDLRLVDAASRSARLVAADFHAPERAGSGRTPTLVFPFSRFDPRLVCLEDASVRTGACLRAELPFLDRVAVFASGR